MADLLKMGYAQAVKDASMAGISLHLDENLPYTEACHYLGNIIQQTGSVDLQTWMYRVDIPEAATPQTPGELAELVIYRSCQKVYTRLHYGS